MKKIIPLCHPYIILAYFVLSSLVSIWKYELTISNEQLILLIIIPAILFLLTNIFILRKSKNSIKTSLNLTLAISAIFFYSTWNTIIYEITVFQLIVQSLKLYPKLASLFLMITIIGICIFLIFRIKSNLKSLSIYLTLLTLCLSIYSLIDISFLRLIPQIRLENSFNPNKVEFKRKPDIYYIIADSYTSNKSLEKYWNFNNSKFTESLKKKGFYIAENSQSNYNFTSSSITSSLNSSYLNVENMASLGSENIKNLFSLINNSRVPKLLTKYSYKQISYSYYPILNTTNAMKNVQLTANISNTLYGSLFVSLKNRWGNESEIATKNRYYFNSKSLSFLDHTTRLSDDLTPNFVFVHTLTTHNPYVIDSLGNYQSDLKKSNDRDMYLVEITYLNKRLLSFVDSILARPGRKPIIIIQGDHGSHLKTLSETSTILNAYYFPDNDYSLLYKSISPVNTFRVIFNKYFNTSIPLLPDKTYYINYGGI